MSVTATPTIEVIIEGRAFELPAPARPEEEVRAAVARGETHRGYWATLWPMARQLAAYVLRSPMIDAGMNVVEIGCGLGLVSLAAAAKGASVTATDASEDALERVRLAAGLNGVAVQTRVLNWREALPGDLRPDVVLGADVIYDPADHAPVARLIASMNCPAIIADPGRPNSIGFEQALAACDLRAWQTSLPAGRLLFIQPN